MATAIQHADRTASEARRPEAGSRAGGVSRAERGNDGSPKGRDAAGGSMRHAHDSATGHFPWPGTPKIQSEMDNGTGMSVDLKHRNAISAAAIAGIV